VTRELDEVEPALATLLALGCDTLVLVGGDGTAGATLSALVRVAGETDLPRVVMAGGGSVNTIARSFGARGRADAVIEHWLDAEAPVAEHTHPLLRVTADGDDPRYGMIFGNGMVCRWLERYYATDRGPVAAARTVARSVGSMLVRGPLARQIFARFDATLQIDDAAPRDVTLTGIAASTVRDIGLGFRPFATAGQDTDHFHWIDTDASGLRLGMELPAQFLGTSAARSCLNHASPRRAVVETRVPMAYMIDADLFPAASRITIEAGPAVRFANA